MHTSALQELKKMLALAIYLPVALGTVVSFLSSLAPTWAEFIPALPIFLPLMALALLRDDRPLMWCLDGAVASVEWIWAYITKSPPSAGPEE